MHNINDYVINTIILHHTRLSLSILTTTMLYLFVLSLLALANASALTTAINPNERLCFYADVDKAGQKIGVRLFLVLTSPLSQLPSSTLPSNLAVLSK